MLKEYGFVLFTLLSSFSALAISSPGAGELKCRSTMLSRISAGADHINSICRDVTASEASCIHAIGTATKYQMATLSEWKAAKRTCRGLNDVAANCVGNIVRFSESINIQFVRNYCSDMNAANVDCVLSVIYSRRYAFRTKVEFEAVKHSCVRH